MFLLRLIVILISLNFSWPVLAEKIDKSLPDLLDLPAEMDIRAVHSLLLDLAQAGDRLVAVGERGNILYSDNQGKDWIQARVPVQVTLTAVYFPNPERGWAVGHDGVILHSSDAGESWSKQLDGLQTGELMAIAAQQRLEKLTKAIAVAEQRGKDTEGLSEARDNAEIALDEAQIEIEAGPNRPLLDVWFRNDQEGYASGAFGYLFHTTDGGEHWRDISLQVSNPERLHLYSIQGWSDGTLLVVGEFGFTQRSVDGGKTWQVVDLGYEGTLFNVRRDTGEDKVFIVGLRNNVFLSSDRGQSWQRQDLPPGPSLLGVSSDSGKVVMVGVAGTIVKLNINSGDYHNLSRKNRVNLSSAIQVNNSELIVVGEAGVLRLSATGWPLPVRYAANPLNPNNSTQALIRSDDPVTARNNGEQPGATL